MLSKRPLSPAMQQHLASTPPPPPTTLYRGGGGGGGLGGGGVEASCCCLCPYPPGYIATPGSLYVLYCCTTCKLRYIYLVILILGYDVASLIRHRSNHCMHCKQSSKRARNIAKFVSHLQLILCKNLVYFHALRSMLG